MPSSKGVSPGPIITAFLHVRMVPKEEEWQNEAAGLDGKVPCHDILTDWACADSGWRIRLHSLRKLAMGEHPDNSGMLIYTLKSRIKRRRAVVDILLVLTAKCIH